MSAGSGTQTAAAAAAAAEGAAFCRSPTRLLDVAERFRSSAAATPLLIAPSETGALPPPVSSAAASRGLCGAGRAGMPTAAEGASSCEAPSSRPADAAPGLSGAAVFVFVAAAGTAAELATAEDSGCTAPAGAAADATATGTSCRHSEHVVQPQCETSQAFGEQPLRPRFQGMAWSAVKPHASGQSPCRARAAKPPATPTRSVPAGCEHSLLRT